MKKKGFTLIELLAVIIILAVIALISTPVILKVIERARKGAFEDSAYGVVNAAKLYFADKSFEGKVERETFTFPEDTKLKLSGKRPKSGSVVIEEDGKVEIAITNGIWCALKNKEEDKIRITDDKEEDCKIKVVTSPETCFVPKYTEVTDFDINYDACILTYEGGVENGYYSSSDLENACTNKPSIIFNNMAIKDYYANSENVKNIAQDINAHVIENIKGVSDPSIIGAYSCDEEKVVIPEKINGITVTTIGKFAFSSKSFTNIVLPNSIKKIENGAFTNNNLTSIDIPESVNIIEDSAFANGEIREIKIREGLVSIGDSAFWANRLPTSIELPSTLTSIGDSAFGSPPTWNQQVKLIIKKPSGSITGSPWGASTVEWIG